jgi:CRP/FNR family cyclic AMP-dependent transcriptional regulator
MGILEGRPRTANVIALEPTECLVVNRDQLERLLLEHPSMTMAMLTVMSRRLRAIGP